MNIEDQEVDSFKTICIYESLKNLCVPQGYMFPTEDHCPAVMFFRLRVVTL